MTHIVNSHDGVTVLGGGECSGQTVDEVLLLAPILVAADGAAGRALAAGRMPDAVIGDFDSIRPEDAARIPPGRLHRIEEQDSTDFDKCLRHIRAPFVLAAGFMGARRDHELSAYNALVRRADQRVMMVGEQDVCFVAPRELRIELAPATRVSLFPLAPVSGRSVGLRWPIDGIAMAPDGRVGTSNEATGGAVRLVMEAPGMLVILPREVLRPALAALVAAPGWG
ncbi:MAG: thiamine diphosphokinase [Rhodobacteraceae bacterium]|nr:thiamine diphosphokinase [Paracoccaceae bacterium]